LKIERRREQAYAWKIFELMESFFDGVKRDFLYVLKKKKYQTRSSNSSNGASIASQPLHKKRLENMVPPTSETQVNN
jgi:hypothetical protein